MKPVTDPILCAAASAFDFGGPMVCDPHHYGAKANWIILLICPIRVCLILNIKENAFRHST